METRSRTRSMLRGAAVLAALGALSAPATAGAAVKAPVISSITPKSLNVGQKLIIRGRYFRLGKGKNRVLFQRVGGKSLFVKADVSTKVRMTVVIPSRLETYMPQSGGHPVAATFRLRVLTTKLSKSFTTGHDSPLVGPRPPKPTTGTGSGTGTGTGGTPTTAAYCGNPNGDVDGDGIPNQSDPDIDNDLLSNTLEQSIGTDPCNADSDGDGVEDGYEYQSALDLNNDDYQAADNVHPYPWKMAYPNPLYKDSDVDYDGDGLTLGDEYNLWRYTYTVDHTATRTLTPLSYSDGTRYSLSTVDPATGIRSNFMTDAAYTPPPPYSVGHFGTLPPLAADPMLLIYPAGDHSGAPASIDLHDLDRDGTVTTTPTGNQEHSERYVWDYDNNDRVSDDERDEDGDGLTNFDELHGRMTPGYWKSCYADEQPYPIAYRGTSAFDADSDGDGILDGADDQDFDGVPNMMELSRNMASDRAIAGSFDCDTQGNPPRTPSPAKGRVNPFNPCLPDKRSDSCEQHPIFNVPFPPYDPNGDSYLVLN
jgi:hypothetical protein